MDITQYSVLVPVQDLGKLETDSLARGMTRGQCNLIHFMHLISEGRLTRAALANNGLPEDSWAKLQFLLDRIEKKPEERKDAQVQKVEGVGTDGSNGGSLH